MILELIDIISEPFGLPDWSLKLALFILIAGLFITIIISWIYDIHPKEGIVKTQSADTIKPEDKPVTSSRWRIATYVSFVVIVGLVVLNVMGRGKQIRPGDIQRVLILPFANYTGADSLDFFVDGMHSSLITEMQRISGLHVINETSSNAFKNVDMQLHEIAQELNVDAVVEGVVSCIGDNICTDFKLISGSPEEELLWIDDYIEERSQILNFYKRITKQIAEEVKVELTPEEEQFLAKSRTVDREAYDDYLRSYNFMEDRSKEAVHKAMEYLNNAIEKDPDWAPLYAGLARVWINLAQMGFESHSVAYKNVYDNLDKALELDPNLPDRHNISASIAYLYEWNWDKAEMEFIKALAINPNDAGARISYAHLLLILQRFDEMFTQAQLALDLDPLNLMIQAMYAPLGEDYKTVTAAYEKILAVDPEHYLAKGMLAGGYYVCGEYDRAWELDKPNNINIFGKDEFNEIEKVYNERGYPAAKEEMVRRLEGMAESGNVGPINMIGPVTMAELCYEVNQDDKAIKWLEKGFEMHDPNMPYVFTEYERLLGNPRFIDIAEKMNLPLEKD
jgi:serine/threonine-protein kinase